MKEIAFFIGCSPLSRMKLVAYSFILYYTHRSVYIFLNMFHSFYPYV